MRFVIPVQELKKVVKEGYKSFKILNKRGHSIDFCNDDLCVSVGSARTFGQGSKGFCVGTSRRYYPYHAALEACFNTEVEALSYAIVLMDGIERYGTRWYPDEDKAKIINEYLKAKKAFVCSSGEPLPLPLAVEMEYGLEDFEKWREVCVNTSLEPEI